MGELVPMPKRYTKRNQEPQEAPPEAAGGAVDGQQPRAKRRPLIPKWVKWFGGVAGAAVVGGLAVRKFDQYFPRDRGGEEPAQAPAPAQAMLMPPMMPSMMPMMMPPMMQPMMQQPMYAPPPVRNGPRRPDPNEMTIGELQILMKRKQDSEKQRAAILAEEEFWEG